MKRISALIFLSTLLSPILAQDVPELPVFTLSDFYAKNNTLDEVVNQKFQSLSVEERAAQMIMPAIGIKNFGLTPQKALALYKAKKIGGVLFLKGTTSYFTQAAASFDSASEELNLVKPLITCDGESALFHYKFIDQPRQTPAAQMKSYDEVISNSKKIALIINAMGIHVNFAPVVDNNVNKAIISNRSYGANADEITPMAGAFILAHQNLNKGTVLKHFPGHGAISGDSHKGLVSIKGECTELETFARLIKNAKPIGVMVGHIAVLNNPRWNTNGLPSTLSRRISTNLLKDSLNFKGIAFTDAMNMGAVSKIPNASYQAALAGNDIILMPLKVEELHTQIVNELKKNSPAKRQFEESIKKILRLKFCLGID